MVNTHSKLVLIHQVFLCLIEFPTLFLMIYYILMYPLTKKVVSKEIDMQDS